LSSMTARGATVGKLSEAALPTHAAGWGGWAVAGGAVLNQCAAAASVAPPFRQVLMKVLRSAPLSAFVLASALQDFIFSCWVVLADGAAAAALSPFRHELMNVLRSAPFLPVACLLQSMIRCCWAVCGLVAAAAVFAGVAAKAAPAKAKAALTASRRSDIDIVESSLVTGGCRPEQSMPIQVAPAVGETRLTRSIQLQKGRPRRSVRRGLPGRADVRVQAASALALRGPSRSALRTCDTIRSTSALVTLKCGVKRNELVPPWITPMPCSRMNSSVESAP